MTALACGPEAAGLVHEFVFHADLLMLCDNFPAVFGEVDAVLYLLELLFNGRRWHPRGGHIFFVYIELLVGVFSVRSKEVSDDLKGSEVIVPKVLVPQCSDEAVVNGGNGLHLQHLFRFFPDA